MDFEFAVLEFPETKVAGIKIETDMKNAQKDCAALWESFGPRVYGELSVNNSIPERPSTYGVCKMIDNDRFAYWAAVEIDSTDKIPSDLEIISIPLAMYATCQVPGIKKLGEAYKAIYEEWPPTQIDYAIDGMGIYVPVTMKEPN